MKRSASAVGDTYLPIGFSERVLQRVSLGDWQPLIDELPSLREYERVGIDRALAIATDLALTPGASASRILDVGCSVGTIAMLLALAGHRVTGIDSDVVASVQDWQDPELLEQSRGRHAVAGCTLLRQDLREHLFETSAEYDVSLLLSVVHHWLPGYGYTGAQSLARQEMRQLLTDLCQRTRRCLYLEMPITDEAAEMPPDPTGEFLFPGWFLEAGLARDVVMIASTLATNAKPRRLYRIDLD